MIAASMGSRLAVDVGRVELVIKITNKVVTLLRLIGVVEGLPSLVLLFDQVFLAEDLC